MSSPSIIEIRRTAEFATWFEALRDRRAKARIAVRLDRAAAGHLGDVRSVGDGVSEMRIDYGPGYRVYIARRGDALIILLCGGDKGSQSRDILRAKTLAASLGVQL